MTVSVLLEKSKSVVLPVGTKRNWYHLFF